jgi:hypothetical protein
MMIAEELIAKAAVRGAFLSRKREIQPETKTRLLFWCLAMLFGGSQAWSARATVANDTVSYLDMGHYLLHGHWSQVINGLWNPLYACLLGLTISLFRPSPYREYPLVHVLLFFIFLFALASFDFFLRELILFRQEHESTKELSAPIWVWLTIGYAVFLWSSLQLIGVWESNPDIIIAAFFYLACGFLIRIRRGVIGWSTYLALGLVLGLGYLTKAVMFPVSLLCFAVAWLIGGSLRPGIPRVLAGLLIFLAVSGPFIVALSVVKGGFTFGETGRYNYAVHVNKVPAVHWQGENATNGLPVHATHKIFERPATFEFASPVAGTYPVWYDPTFWYEGIKVRFDPREEVRTMLKNLRWEIELFFYLNGSIVATWFVLFYVGGKKLHVLRDLRDYWFLFVPAITTPFLYSLVHWEPRYIAPFLVVVIVCCFLSIHLPETRESRRLFPAVAVLMSVMLICPLGPGSIRLKTGIFDLLPSRDDPNSDPEVAGEMYRIGLHPGDRIASLCYSNLGMSNWAHLAGLRIIAEVYYWPGRPETLANDFWDANPATQVKVIQVLASTGASAVISQEAPRGSGGTGWVQVGRTQYYIHWLRPLTTSLAAADNSHNTL